MLALTEGLARLKTFHKTFDDASDDDDDVTMKMMIILFKLPGMRLRACYYGLAVTV